MDNKKLTVLMFSGGIDSTGALYRLLTQTDNDVVAHHINMVNRENRATPEHISCGTIVKYLNEKIRYFEYTESTFEFPYSNHIGWDIITSMYIGALVSKNYINAYSTVELCIGDTKDDFGAYKWKSPIAQSIALITSLEDPRKQVQSIPIITQPVVDLTKEDILKMIPDELFMMTWTCRTPVVSEIDTGTKFKECGICSTCKTLIQLNYFKNKEYTITRRKNT